MNKRVIFWFIAFVCAASALQARINEPVRFTSRLTATSDGKAEVTFTATIENGWHLYSTDIPEGGPTAAKLVIESIEGVRLDGGLMPVGTPESAYDEVFGMQVSYFSNRGEFVQRLTITSTSYSLVGYLEYGACNDTSCLPPTKYMFRFSSESESNAADADSGTGDTPQGGETADELSARPYWQPVIEQLDSFGDSHGGRDNTSLYIFLAGLLGGLLALLTPCVWPIIPMTVSFFLKRTDSRAKSRRDAALYGVSIVVIYLSLGLLVTLIFGANALNALSTSAFFNLLFFAMLVAFAVSFFGAFDMVLPSSWTNAVDRGSERKGGVTGIFLMAFTLALVSFSCTGPIIGFLLVEVSTSGGIAAPAIGMLGFAIALALPFSLFALFPSWLKSLPRSGGWMNTVRVVLGFVELAFSLKFLSVADLAYGWGVLDREVFVALWIALAVLLGIYLLGKIRFAHDQKSDNVGIVRFMFALMSFAFAIYMLPGLWGAPLKAISAFAPPLSTMDFNLNDREADARFDDFDEGMAFAARNGLPVMVDFTGYGCVNCRKMEQTVLSDEEVKRILADSYVLITLHVDDKRPLPEPIRVNDNGSRRTLRTYGDMWSYLQRSKFGANAQPFYVLLDNDGEPLSSAYGYDNSVDNFMKYLESGLYAAEAKSKR